MQIKTIESVTESEIRLTLTAESPEEMAQLRDFALNLPPLGVGEPAELTASFDLAK